jgi:hypothetical protein
MVTPAISATLILAPVAISFRFGPLTAIRISHMTGGFSPGAGSYFAVNLQLEPVFEQRS